MLYPTELWAARRMILQSSFCRSEEKTGRGETIRTSDHLIPNQVRYQAALRPESTHNTLATGTGQMNLDFFSSAESSLQQISFMFGIRLQKFPRRGALCVWLSRQI